MGMCYCSDCRQTAGFRQVFQSFDQTFSKVCEVEGAEPSSPSAEGEISLGISLLQAFLFVPLVSKRKATKEFVQLKK